MRWDLFCRVIDNFGDIGVCWRLAAELARRGQTVRLWLDDATALRWMAPQGAPGVTVVPWTTAAPALEPGDVVVEAFGCDPPPDFVARMAAMARPPVWINLEYLSAEAYVERSHGLPSPVHSGAGRGLVKWFFYPGFTPRTGGLLRSTASASTSESDAALVFCYANPMLPRLAEDWPGRLLLAPGAAQTLDAPRVTRLDWLTQTGFDALLTRCALNFVRGEDSFVQAVWAGRPFVWQIYPQDDGAHRAKLEAFLDQFLAGADATLADDLRRLWRAWNGLGDWPAALARCADLVGLVRRSGATACSPSPTWSPSSSASSRKSARIAGFARRPPRRAANVTKAGAKAGARLAQYHAAVAAPHRIQVMKIAQEIRAGNVIMQGKDPMVVLKTEYSRGGRNAATVRMKMKNLLNGGGAEVVFKADDKMDQIVLDKKECTYTYFADPMYVFMDAEYNQFEVEAENMGDAINYLEDNMTVEVVFYDGKAISVETADLGGARDRRPSRPSRATPRARS